MSTTQSIARSTDLALSPVRPELRSLAPYGAPGAGFKIDLALDANEGPGGDFDIANALAGLFDERLRRYPSAATLEGALAARLRIEPERVIATSGGDDAIDRVCRACLSPGRDIILPSPTFEMIGRYASVAGAGVVSVPWPGGDYPLEAVLKAVNERTAIIAVVSPNNPTGATIQRRDLVRLAEAVPDVLLLVDLAYTEFADEDLTEAALAHPNAVVVRTFSKAYSLAAVRVGYAAGPPHVVRAMRSVGAPYPVSAPSLTIVMDQLERGAERVARNVARVREERTTLAEWLSVLGARPVPGQGNFVLAHFKNAELVWRALSSLGIGVRRFTATGLEDALRITCPGDAGDFDRLRGALAVVLRPQAIIFDMDGVLADVSRSYRRAIALTAGVFGVALSERDIAAAKARGDANNDWVLTQRLLADQGVEAPLEAVTRTFEALYQGDGATPGLRDSETLIPSLALLERLAARLPLAIVTGRPNRDCERFLDRFGVRSLFRVCVCMEDAPVKPDPIPVRLALARLGVMAAWMIGDTPDDVAAARAAGIVPLGIAPPGDDAARARASLEQSGAARVLESLSEIEEMLS